MKTYRKRPVEVQEAQLTRDNVDEVRDWVGARVEEEWLPGPGRGASAGLKIVTLEGEMSVVYGSWVIRGVQGEFYQCQDDIFRATYEAVE